MRVLRLEYLQRVVGRANDASARLVLFRGSDFGACACKIRPWEFDLVSEHAEIRRPRLISAADFNSAFPAGVNVAATFDRGLAYARGQAMGEEHRGKGVDVQLGPVAGPLGRSPEGGRNWEGFR